MIKNEEKEIDKIAQLLKTSEELKTMLYPLIEKNKTSLQILEKYGSSIEELMNYLIGSKKEHEQQKQKLEIIQNNIHEIEHSLTLVKAMYERQEKKSKKVSKLDNKIIKELYENIYGIKEKFIIANKELDEINKLINKYSKNPFIYGMKASVLNLLNREEDAINFINDALIKFPKSSRLWYVKAIITPYSKYEEIIEYLDKSYKLTNKKQIEIRHIILHKKAQVLFENRKYKEALYEINESLEKIMNCSSAWSLKADINYQLNNLSDAFGSIQKAIELDDKDTISWTIKGNILSSFGEDKYEEALEYYDKAIELDEKNETAIYNKGITLRNIDKNEEALIMFNKFIELYPNEPCAWCNKGAILNDLNQYNSSIECFNKTVELDLNKTIVSNCSLLYVCKGIALFNLDKLDESKKSFEKALEINPNDKEAQNRLKKINKILKKEERNK